VQRVNSLETCTYLAAYPHASLRVTFYNIAAHSKTNCGILPRCISLLRIYYGFGRAGTPYLFATYDTELSFSRNLWYRLLTMNVVNSRCGVWLNRRWYRCCRRMPLVLWIAVALCFNALKLLATL